MEESAADLAVLATAWRDAQGRDSGRLDAFSPDCAIATDPVAASGDIGAAGFDDELIRACGALTHAILRDLGGHGFDPSSIRGFYSGSYSTAEGDQGGWSLPCHAGGRTVVHDAVHVGLVAHWNGPGWAAAQAMPDGVPMGAEAVGQLAGIDDEMEGGSTLPPCGTLLEIAPPWRRPSVHDGSTDARRLAESVPTRTAFGG